MFKHHGVFYCSLCEKQFDNLDDMRDHVEYENEVLEARCILCKQNFAGPDKAHGLKEHLLQCHFGPMVMRRPPVFEDKTSSCSDVELITHISLSYKPNKTETYQFDNYSCPHCQRKFSAKSGLKIHVGIAHKGGKILFCPRCPASFSDVDGCKIHFREEHAARKKIKKKDTSEVTPHKSLVPTNEPMEGQAAQTVVNNVASVANEMSKFHFVSTSIENINLNNNNINQTRLQAATVSSPSTPDHPPATPNKQNIFSDKIIEQVLKPLAMAKPKPKKPLPGLVKIQDMNSFLSSSTEKKFEKPASKPPRRKPITKKDPTDIKKRTNKSEEWITTSGQGNTRLSSQPDNNSTSIPFIPNKNIPSTLATSNKNLISSIPNTQVMSIISP